MADPEIKLPANSKFIPSKVAQRCVVCNGFGSLKYGTKVCQACSGSGYLLVPAIEKTDENDGQNGRNHNEQP